LGYPLDETCPSRKKVLLEQIADVQPLEQIRNCLIKKDECKRDVLRYPAATRSKN
jgi:hypothetical protein